ncbi:tripartite tricarboxylate transporter substrate binding protein [Thermatribacter velox]|uniref:Tripartite tricarboxylate transporter substrate binding protein n=1 Tax=Thermatribacter velox TaxID=3039681 RepID=A0ABZ2Y8N6_9BACT
MRKNRVFVVGVLVLALFSFVFLTGVASADFPEKEILLIIQAAPGGVSDAVGRAMAAAAQEFLGVPITATNITGASGAIAMGKLKESKPDGYTIGYVPVELSMVKALGYADISPDDFDLIMRTNIVPAALTVRSDAPYKTFEEFVAYAKEHPGEILVGTSGTGSIWHIAGLALEEALGVKFTFVPFDGAAPSVAALLGGHIHAVTCSPSEVLSGVQSGDLRMLAVLGDSRTELFPDVPTAKELGYDINVMAWGGFALPKGTPKEVYDKIADAFYKAFNSETFTRVMKERGIQLAYLDGPSFAEFAKQQYEMYMELIPRAMGKSGK